LAVRDVNSTQDLEEKFGDKVITVQADVSDTASIQALAQQTTDVDIVVNNAVGTSISPW
jgi:NADP-dependent 3-hydroxy acid dehydrogenase YdfG